MKRTRWKQSFEIFLPGCLLLGWVVPVLAIDLQPGDGTPPKPATRILHLSQQFSERDGFYKNGIKQADSGYRVVNSLLRVGYAFELAKQPAFVYGQLPVGYVHPSGTLAGIKGDSGVGDLALALAYWPYANRETETYLGLAAYLIAPTGSYRPERAFNMGENRWSSALQVGLQKSFSRQVLAMVALDSVWFGDNEAHGAAHARLEKKALTTGQVALRYSFLSKDSAPKYHLGVSYFDSFGGATQVNAIERADRTDLQRYLISGTADTAFGRFVLQYGGDLATENGFKETERWTVRYLRMF
jgi:hypothetical protein